MLGHIAGPLAQAIFVLIAVSVIAFALLSFTGDPVAMILGPEAAPQDRTELRARLRLDDPFALRYLRYVGRLLQGELGLFYATGQPVARVLAERIPATLELALVAVLLSLALGIPLGIATAIHRDSALARAVMTLSLLGLSHGPHFARLVRGATMVERDKDYVAAARVMGRPPSAILLQHILPNVVNPILVLGTLDIAYAIMGEATLSFLGLGVPPNQPSLGALIRQGYSFLFSGVWWIVIFPCALLVVPVVVINVLGDWLREALNPRLR